MEYTNLRLYSRLFYVHVLRLSQILMSFLIKQTRLTPKDAKKNCSCLRCRIYLAILSSLLSSRRPTKIAIRSKSYACNGKPEAKVKMERDKQSPS